MTHEEFCAKEERIVSSYNFRKGIGDYPGHKAFDLPPITNRQALKQQKRADKDKVTMTKAELEKYVQNRLDKEHDRMLRSTCRFVSVVFCMQLHEKFGFGGKRLGKLADDVNDLTDCMERDYVKWEELRDTLAEETGLFIKIGGD